MGLRTSLDSLQTFPELVHFGDGTEKAGFPQDYADLIQHRWDATASYRERRRLARDSNRHLVPGEYPIEERIKEMRGSWLN